MLEWKEMGFKALKVTMSPRYMWKTRNRSAVAKIYLDERRTVLEKGKLPSFYCSDFEVCKKNIAGRMI